MKTVDNLNVGDVCDWFSGHGEFEREVKVSSIKVDDKYYRIKIEFQGIVVARKNDTYGESVDFPGKLCFFSKESAVKYFINNVERTISILKDSIVTLFND